MTVRPFYLQGALEAVDINLTFVRCVVPLNNHFVQPDRMRAGHLRHIFQLVQRKIAGKLVDVGQDILAKPQSHTGL